MAKPPVKRISVPRPRNAVNGRFEAKNAYIPDLTTSPPGMGFRRGTGYGVGAASWETNATKAWSSRPGSPDSDIVLNIDLIRSRSRELFMNSPLAAAVVNTTRVYTVSTGIKPLPKINYKRLKITEKEAEEFNEDWSEEFNLWANSTACDWYRRMNFYQLQDLAIASMLLNGDAPTLLPYLQRPGDLYALKIRMIEADRLCNPLYWNYDRNILGGVELGDTGEVISYHVRQIHPHQNFYPAAVVEKMFDWVEIDAYGKLTGRPNLLLISEYERCEQRRGVPILAKIIEILADFTRFVKAEVSASEMTARFIATVESEFPDENFLEKLTKEERDSLYRVGRYNVIVDESNIVNFLRPGNKLNLLKSERPSGTFDPFVTAISKLVGAACGVPYEILLSCFSSSYSASRAAFNLFEKRIKVLQNIIISQFCQPVYEQLMDEAVEEGIIKAPGYFEDPRIRAAYTRCKWIATPMGSIDPTKDIQASKDLIIIGASDCEAEAAKLTGTNYKHNVAQLGKEVKEFHAEGLNHPMIETPITRTQRIMDESVDDTGAPTPGKPKAPPTAPSGPSKSPPPAPTAPSPPPSPTSSKRYVTYTLDYDHEPEPGEVLRYLESTRT
jgi:lambda family phage portal protein